MLPSREMGWRLSNHVRQVASETCARRPSEQDFHNLSESIICDQCLSSELCPQCDPQPVEKPAECGWAPFGVRPTWAPGKEPVSCAKPGRV